MAICVAAQDSIRADLVALAFTAQWHRVFGESTLAGMPTVILIDLSHTTTLFQISLINGICAAKMQFPHSPHGIRLFDQAQLMLRTQHP